MFMRSLANDIIGNLAAQFHRLLAKKRSCWPRGTIQYRYNDGEKPERVARGYSSGPL